MESLWSQYRMDPPPGLSSGQEQTWVNKKRRPTQRRWSTDVYSTKSLICLRVLTIFKDWLEYYWLVDDDPHLIPRIQQKLSLVTDSSTQQVHVKDISQSIERVGIFLLFLKSLIHKAQASC